MFGCHWGGAWGALAGTVAPGLLCPPRTRGSSSGFPLCPSGLSPSRGGRGRAGGQFRDVGELEFLSLEGKGWLSAPGWSQRLCPWLPSIPAPFPGRASAVSRKSWGGRGPRRGSSSSCPFGKTPSHGKRSVTAGNTTSPSSPSRIPQGRIPWCRGWSRCRSCPGAGGGSGTAPRAERTLWGFPERGAGLRCVSTLNRQPLSSIIPERGHYPGAHSRGEGDDREKVLKFLFFNPGEGGRTLSIKLVPGGSKCHVPVTSPHCSIKEKQTLFTSPVKDCAEFGTKKMILLKKTLRNGNIK